MRPAAYSSRGRYEQLALPVFPYRCPRTGQELQSLGEELIALNNAKLAQLNLPEALYDAVKEAQRITSNSALARPTRCQP